MSISFFQRDVLTKVRNNTDLHGRSYDAGPSRTRDALIRMGLIERHPERAGYIVTNAGRLKLEPILKTCSCGKTYSKTTWKLLDFVSYFDDDAPAIPEHPEYGEPKGRMEQRNCVCGSTIVVPLSDLAEKIACKGCGVDLKPEEKMHCYACANAMRQGLKPRKAP